MITMPALHLIQNQSHPKLLPKPEQPGSDVWISGYWVLAVDTVRSLIGGRVYFHKAQAKPSFFGGEILDFRVANEPPYAGRIILLFQFDPQARGVRAGPEGWAMEMKIVLNEPQP
jgi:hypothetical protein